MRTANEDCGFYTLGKYKDGDEGALLSDGGPQWSEGRESGLGWSQWFFKCFLFLIEF